MLAGAPLQVVLAGAPLQLVLAVVLAMVLAQQ
jgi:hypothetical protein